MPYTERIIRTARGRAVKVRRFSAFAEPPEAGQQLRPNPDAADRFANDYQRDLVRVYDRWADGTQRAVANAVRDSLSQAEVQRIIDARLADLQVELEALGRARIAQASGLGLGKRLGHRATDPAVLAKIAQLQSQNAEFIRTKLMVQLRERFLRELGDLLAIQQPGVLSKTLKGLFDSQRYRPAQYAGGAVVAIFETQREAGKAENQERQAKGEAPIPVRWMLEPGALHCQDDPGRGTFGCPSLARGLDGNGVYPDGWDSLPTVPAGATSCLGNCKCRIEADFGNGWERIT